MRMSQEHKAINTARNPRLASVIRGVNEVVPLMFLITMGALGYSLWEAGIPTLLSLIIAFTLGMTAFLLLYCYFRFEQLYWLVLLAVCCLVSPKLARRAYDYELLTAAKWQLEVLASVGFFGCCFAFRRHLQDLVGKS
jgi:hypothetical protein